MHQGRGGGCPAWGHYVTASARLPTSPRGGLINFGMTRGPSFDKVLTGPSIIIQRTLLRLSFLVGRLFSSWSRCELKLFIHWFIIVTAFLGLWIWRNSGSSSVSAPTFMTKLDLNSLFSCLFHFLGSQKLESSPYTVTANGNVSHALKTPWSLLKSFHATALQPAQVVVWYRHARTFFFFFNRSVHSPSCGLAVEWLSCVYLQKTYRNYSWWEKLIYSNLLYRGKQSLETICLVMAYKLKYPNNFFLLRGNHECAAINRWVAEC